MRPRSSAAAATLAARRICREGESWSAAFAAAREETGESPREEDVAREIRAWFALFAPEAHAETLLRKRRAALGVMERAPGLGLVLTGVVLSGAATERSVAELVTRTADEKEAVMGLLSAGLPADPFEGSWLTAFARRAGRGLVTLLTELAGEPVLVRVAPPRTPMPAAAEPDDNQLPAEAAGWTDAAALAALLAEREDLRAAACEKTRPAAECAPIILRRTPD